MSVLVTGGAGYIGSHVIRALHGDGEDVVVVDDLSTGDLRRTGDVALEQLDLAAQDAVTELRSVLRRYQVDAVIHLAAKKRVDESVQRPVWYYEQNVGGMTALLTAMAAERVRNLVFSSSAAVYGDVRVPSVSEAVETRPVNPYGQTKLAGEWLAAAAHLAGQVSACSLRYFNVAGTGEAQLTDTGIANLIPIVISRMLDGQRPVIFGTDYDTEDGTCVRDYVHVVDLARAHVAALRAVRDDSASPVYNIGTGTGYSVRQVIDEVGAQLGVDPCPDERPRRVGDPAAVVADPRLAEQELGWRADHGLRDIIASSVAGLQALRAERGLPDRRSEIEQPLGVAGVQRP